MTAKRSRKRVASVREYVASKPKESRASLEAVRRAILKALPNAQEGLAYQMPAYTLNGVGVLYFAGWKSHYSLYPASDALVEAFAKERDERRQNGRQAALQAARGAESDQVTHDEPEIEATRMNQEPLQDVRVAAQMRPAHRARFIKMRIRPFQELAPPPQQRQPARAMDAPAR